MKLRELAQLTLTGRENARRLGSTFQLNHFRLASMGILPAEIELVMKAVRDIEHFTETTLSALSSGECPLCHGFSDPCGNSNCPQLSQANTSGDR